MIKLVIEDATLATLDAALIPFVQWKGLKVSDLEGVSEEVLSKNIFKMSTTVIKSLIKNKRISTPKLSDDEWNDLAIDMHREDKNIFEYVQMPYSALRYILEQNYGKSRFASYIATTQESFPVQDALECLSASQLNTVLIQNTLPALVDFMFTEEGIEIMKKKNDLRYVQFLTTEEARKLGLTGNALKNRRISTQLLRRAGACDAGANYCSRILKELKIESITWDEAIVRIRNNPKLQQRNSLISYMNWIRECRHLINEV